jgi:BlaI family transcriptional regulator, penicillinase repressor
MNISDSESRVMEALWREHPLTSSELVERVAAPEGWSPKTVRTLLDRLVRKSAVERERLGRLYCYRPLLDRNTWIREKAGHLVDKHFGGRLAPLVAAFADSESLSDADRDEILRLLEKMQ